MFACLLQGPSQVLHFPDNLYWIFVSQIFLGVFGCINLVVVLPEMMVIAAEIMPDQEDNPLLKDSCSGIFNMVLGMG